MLETFYYVADRILPVGTKLHTNRQPFVCITRTAESSEFWKMHFEHFRKKKQFRHVVGVCPGTRVFVPPSGGWTFEYGGILDDPEHPGWCAAEDAIELERDSEVAVFAEDGDIVVLSNSEETA